MKKIRLTDGQIAKVDDCDFEYLMQWTWHSVKVGQMTYAARIQIVNNKPITIFMHDVVARRAGIK